jgi:hypothetical protein
MTKSGGRVGVRRMDGLTIGEGHAMHVLAALSLRPQTNRVRVSVPRFPSPSRFPSPLAMLTENPNGRWN